jgi:hypothetical protein
VVAIRRTGFETAFAFASDVFLVHQPIYPLVAHCMCLPAQSFDQPWSAICIPAGRVGFVQINANLSVSIWTALAMLIVVKPRN